MRETSTPVQRHHPTFSDQRKSVNIHAFAFEWIRSVPFSSNQKSVLATPVPSVFLFPMSGSLIDRFRTQTVQALDQQRKQFELEALDHRSSPPSHRRTFFTLGEFTVMSWLDCCDSLLFFSALALSNRKDSDSSCRMISQIWVLSCR